MKDEDPGMSTAALIIKTCTFIQQIQMQSMKLDQSSGIENH